jgi:hypothetical protein
MPIIGGLEGSGYCICGPDGVFTEFLVVIFAIRRTLLLLNLGSRLLLRQLSTAR